jgi:hypothetical protein
VCQVRVNQVNEQEHNKNDKEEATQIELLGRAYLSKLFGKGGDHPVDRDAARVSVQWDVEHHRYGHSQGA